MFEKLRIFLDLKILKHEKFLDNLSTLVSYNDC